MAPLQRENEQDDPEEAKGCVVDEYEGLEHIVVPSSGSEGFDIRCFKQTEIILENTATGHQRTFPKLFISIEPHLSIILNILEREWVAHLLQMSESRWVSSQTSRGLASAPPDEYSTQVSRTRRSQSAVFGYGETPTIAEIEQRVALIARVDVKHLERLVMVKYHPGDYFKEHHDGPFRSHTILIYLNDVEGGETVFPSLNLAVKPIGNSGLYWRNTTEDGRADFRMVHAGTSPKMGTKYVVNCFFNFAAVRDQ
ncbi:2OG-Fe(II) oxygenase family protein [Babesia ovata]|uniref:2OG-Fe(II) oxygenase family protein n=1 Tax=Babesia ovata TaxID=189622 RepID=A0A2H6KHT5_9APIC|nr:2OG-Fe(II) oxygenase family protein [Babesia ovata]GBE62550.1 2OG-Fe(II) oxygenase family protein [Babesia ovata]